MLLTEDQIDIIEDNNSNANDSNPSNVSTSENLADIFTRKKAKIMHPNVGKFKSTGLALSTSQQEYDDRKKTLENKFMNKLAGCEIAGVTQVVDEEDFMPKNYKEYQEKLDQEERLEFDNYQHDLDSQDIYESDYVSDEEEVDGTANKEDESKKVDSDNDDDESKKS